MKKKLVFLLASPSQNWEHRNEMTGKAISVFFVVEKNLSNFSFDAKSKNLLIILRESVQIFVWHFSLLRYRFKKKTFFHSNAKKF
jgi:hypothetical protein